MKLVRFSTNGQTPRLGVLQGDRIGDLQASVAASLTRRGVTRAAEIAAALVPSSTRDAAPRQRRCDACLKIGDAVALEDAEPWRLAIRREADELHR